MAVASFRDGVWTANGETPLAVQLDKAAAGPGFVWIDLTDPEPADLDEVAALAGLPDTAVAVVSREQARPRLEHHGGRLVVVLKTAVYVDRDEVIDVGQLAFIIGEHVVVSVATGPQPEHRPLPGGDLDLRALALGPAGVLAGVASRVVRSYAPVLAGLDQDVDEIEAQVFSGDRGGYAERIYRLKSEVQLFRRAVAALPDELEELLDDEEADAVEGDEHLDEVLVRLRGVRAEAARVGEQVASLDDLLNSALSAHLAQIGVRQNEDMRRISAWVAIAAVPTALAAVYGMNFQHMPELDWRYGYFVVLGVMATACLVLYRLFKRSGWL
ncbi:MAG TPA: magnesium and cobalt transport protein CorA [Egicoccus sp.]|nr:magnesium and cobalt transport protein CorA [Egicoccus sp.]HSK24472.1 magnesium and cobalt transport protein CorA [Egicoccus sp.]